MDAILLRGIPTQVIRCPASGPDLILLLSGNPGLIQLYRPFCGRLVALGQGAWSVVAAAHAGHAPGHLHPVGPESWFTLADQLAHHQALLQTMPGAGRVHVVGHSIGAWLGLHLYDALPPARRGRLVMLMPTVEGMAQTPNGRRLAPLLTPAGQRGAVGLLTALRALPLAARRRLVARLYLGDTPAPDRAALTEGLLGLDGPALVQVLRLAREELQTVVEPPRALLTAHAAHLSVALAAGDGWNLPDAAACFPAASVWQAPAGTRHAFLFGPQVEGVATWVAEQCTASPKDGQV